MNCPICNEFLIQEDNDYVRRIYCLSCNYEEEYQFIPISNGKYVIKEGD